MPEPSPATSLSSLLTIVAPAPARPTDELILAALSGHFGVDEETALSWINDFNVGAQYLRLEEAA